MPLTKSAKITGNICPPWGTPEVTLTVLNQKPLILITCFLSDKYELKHDNRGSPNPRFNRMLNNARLFTWSKAFAKSK
jgi:hypothetical protein